MDETQRAQLNPEDPFDRIVAWQSEADLEAVATPIIGQYQRGLLTYDELVSKLIESRIKMEV